MAGAFQAHHLQPRTTAEAQPKSNHNKDPEAHQIINQITTTEIKAQNNQNQNNPPSVKSNEQRLTNHKPQITNHKSMLEITDPKSERAYLKKFLTQNQINESAL